MEYKTAITIVLTYHFSHTLFFYFGFPSFFQMVIPMTSDLNTVLGSSNHE